ELRIAGQERGRRLAVGLEDGVNGGEMVGVEAASLGKEVAGLDRGDDAGQAGSRQAGPPAPLERLRLAPAAAPNPQPKVGPLAGAVEVSQEEPGVDLTGGAGVRHRRNDRFGEQRVLARRCAEQLEGAPARKRWRLAGRGNATRTRSGSRS